MGVGQGMFDLGQGFGRCRSQIAIAGRLDQAGAQRQRVELLIGKGQRRQVEARTQHIADTGLAVDRCARTDKVCDVAIDGALGHFKAVTQLVCGDGTGRRFAQGLDDADKTFCATH